MRLSELKQSIIDRVSKIEDEEFLAAIKIILDSTNISSEFKLNAQHLERIKLVRIQHNLGETILHDELLNEINQWLRTK